MQVIKNYLYNAGYQILLMFAPLITTPYISRVLGPHASGINSYTNGWVTFFCLIGQMGITLYGNREVAYRQNDKRDRSRIFWGIESLQLCTITLSFVAYISVVLLFSSTFKCFYLLQSLWIISYGLDVSWYFMGMEDFKKTVVRNTAVKLITIGLIFVIVRQEGDLWKYILLLGLAQIGGNLTLWPYLRHSVQWVPIKEWHAIRHLYPAIILFVPTITTQIYMVVNRLMLGRIGTPNALGQFDYADKLVKIVLAVVTATGTVMLPHVASMFAKNDVKGIRQSLYKSFEFVTALSLPMAAGVMAVGLKLAPWFLGRKYGASGKVMFIEAVAIVFIAWSNVLGTQYLMPIKRVREFTSSVMCGAIINIIANFFLIPKYSTSGAAMATVIAEFSVTVVQLYFVRTTISRRRLYFNLWRYLLSSVIMFFIVFRLDEIMNMTAINLVIQVFIGVMIYVIGLVVFKAPILKSVRQLKG